MSWQSVLVLLFLSFSATIVTGAVFTDDQSVAVKVLMIPLIIASVPFILCLIVLVPLIMIAMYVVENLIKVLKFN